MKDLYSLGLVRTVTAWDMSLLAAQLLWPFAGLVDGRAGPEATHVASSPQMGVRLSSRSARLML